MLSAEAQERLTRVGPGTPMGALLRRYWLPAGVVADLAPGQTQRVRILGEDLLLVRDASGRPGLLDTRCPHRGASLHLGAIDAEGIRCPYHGWKFDTRGRCLEIPSEAPGSALAERVRARAYPVQELGGLVFAYLGPDPAPALPRYDLFVQERVLRDVGVAELPCNWLQIMENSVDPMHVEWLHGVFGAHVAEQAGTPQARAYRRRHARIGFDVFEHGIVKRRVLEGGSETDDDWAVGHPLVFPFMVRIGGYRQSVFQIRVPIDDTHTRHFWYSTYAPPPGVAGPEQREVPSFEVPWRDARGDYIVDTVPGQDIMTWVSQGPIADRTREQLARSDEGIVLLRKLLFEQLERVARGEDPLGVLREDHDVIALPHERDRLDGGDALLEVLFRVGHARYSPIRDEILALLSQKPE